MQHPGLQQGAHHHGNATDSVQVDHVVPPVGLDVRDVRNPATDPVEVVQSELHLGFMGDRQ